MFLCFLSVVSRFMVRLLVWFLFGIVIWLDIMISLFMMFFVSCVIDVLWWLLG